MQTNQSERDRWRSLGHAEPYWAVLTDDRFRSNRMSPADRDDFFASGEREVAQTFRLIDEYFQRGFRPARALDYGCGVGRLALPIARRSGHVIGVDISDDMLREARANATAALVANVEFQAPEDALATREPDLDFVHSFIVFQHIEPSTGMEISRRLLRRLKPGGVAVLHYTYLRQASRVRHLTHALRRRLSIVNAAINVWKGRPPAEPMIPLFEYDLTALLLMVTETTADPVLMVPTDHAGLRGVVLAFRKLPA